ncbi:ABC transporter permease [Sphingobacterium faecium]|jgi:putative ABC transport system permease protein|uniref:ABC transporter permease n=1 Tax=Sphingobacterium faecium TaxID=34087 RepID=UPI003207F450
MNYLKLALRNLSRNRKRTIVTVLTITLGFTALGTIWGMLTNIFSRLKEQAIVNERLGHFTIVKEGYMEEGKLYPEKFLWDNQELEDILKIIKSNSEIDLATPKIILNGMVSNGQTSTIFITEGLIPSDDNALFKTNIDGRVDHINLAKLSDENAQIVSVSEELASNLKVKKGDILTLLTSTKDGVANATDVEVGGIFNSGNPATNDKFILSNLSMIQNLYDTNGALKIIVTVKDINQLDQVQTQVIKELKNKGFNVESQSWNISSLSYEKVKAMFGVIFRVLTIIISVIVLLTILNTMHMNVNERTQEIGTMRAIGLTSGKIVKIFCIEGILMALLGVLTGSLLLFVVKTILTIANISFVPPVASIEVPVAIMPTIPQLVITMVVFTVISTISSFMASRRIAKQNIMNSLKYSN